MIVAPTNAAFERLAARVRESRLRNADFGGGADLFTLADLLNSADLVDAMESHVAIGSFREAAAPAAAAAGSASDEISVLAALVSAPLPTLSPPNAIFPDVILSASHALLDARDVRREGHNWDITDAFDALGEGAEDAWRDLTRGRRFGHHAEKRRAREEVRRPRSPPTPRFQRSTPPTTPFLSNPPDPTDHRFDRRFQEMERRTAPPHSVIPGGYKGATTDRGGDGAEDDDDDTRNDLRVFVTRARSEGAEMTTTDSGDSETTQRESDAAAAGGGKNPNPPASTSTSLGDGLVIRAAIEDATAGDASNPDYALTARVLDVVHADAGTVLVVDEVLSSPVA